MDITPANFAETRSPTEAAADNCAVSAGIASVSARGLLPESLARELWQKAHAELVELAEAEFAEALEAVGTRENFGLDPGIEANAKQREAFWLNLHIEELAMARGCALGRDAAWQRFLEQYREPLTRIAVDMTGAFSSGQELADSLYSELFGLSERDGKRLSPLFRYSGRGSLMGWLRAVLAQRRVNLYRKTSRETVLDEVEVAAQTQEPVELDRLEHLRLALERAISTLAAEERFLLSAYYLDTHTLQEVGAVLRVHEATVSRKLKRATEHIRKELLKALTARGLSRRAAEETLGTDPRDVEINLRKLLQNPGGRTITNKEGRS